MKITQLTPGTGSFHCGSCMRDLTLTRALRKLGHDVTLVPLYLPLVDEVEDADDLNHVQLGGINMYLQQKSALFRHTPGFIDHMLDAPWLLRTASRRVGMTSPEDLGAMTVAMLQGEHGPQVKELFKLIDVLHHHDRPDVLCLSNVLLVGMAAILKRELDVPIVCTLQGEDAFLDALPEPWRRQAWDALADCAAHVEIFLAVSRYHGSLMGERLKLDAARVHVVHNGIDLEGYAPAAHTGPPTIGFLAHLRKEKGLHALVDTFITLKKRGTIPSLRLHIAGTATPADEPYITAQRDKLAAADVASDVMFEQNVTKERKLAMLAQLTVLSVPATYSESFGLYVLEANAMGVPVVQPNCGAFPEVIAATAGGILCKPDDTLDLADQLERVLTDRALHAQLSDAGRRSVFDKFSAAHMAQRVLNAMETACRAASR